jgi:hypothetical protein
MWDRSFRDVSERSPVIIMTVKMKVMMVIMERTRMMRGDNDSKVEQQNVATARRHNPRTREARSFSALEFLNRSRAKDVKSCIYI